MNLEFLRHSAAHILASAVKELYPEAKLGIGPAIADGFYYDFEYSRPFTPEDLVKIEAKMQEIIKADLPFLHSEVSKKDARGIFKELVEPYKLELLEELPEDTVGIYRHANFTDLCKGPHLKKTGEVKAVKLINSAGAYWRGNENNPMLQRIYGTAFPSRKELDEYLRRLDEAKKRDHRKLGPALDLFSFHEEAGAGLVFYHPQGALIRYLLEDFITKEHLNRGYQLVSTPHILKSDIWKTSGHYEHFRNLMYFIKMENQEYALKPMNCPGHILIFKTHRHSYRELPVRFFELGTVYRYEKSGVLHGLLRVRGFTQDDAHIFCAPEQFKEEVNNVLNFVEDVLKIFGFQWEMEISTQPHEFIGRPEDWEMATTFLKEVLSKRGAPFQINEGEGAFYGPKIDVKLKDSLGRTWQGATVQVDFALPERFDINYIGEDGKKHRPVMIHRVILGTLERFLGILIEHFGGLFPLWLAPVQIKALTVTDAQIPYAKKLVDSLREKELRVKADFRNQKIGYKIREGEIEKIPYLLIIGKREVENETVAVRKRGEGDIGTKSLDEFGKEVKKAINNKVNSEGGG